MADTEQKTRSPTPEWGFVALGAADPAGLYLYPVGRLKGAAATIGLASGRPGEAWSAFRLVWRGAGALTVSAADLTAGLRDIAGTPAGARLALLFDRLCAPRAAWSDFTLDRPLVMGVVNVTPDSFSDGGEHLEADAAIAHGKALWAAGADILDIGGESTRPGAAPVALEMEIARVVPVVRALASAGAVVSVDTRHAAVMAAALDAGARIVNDITALADPESLDLVVRRQVPAVLMHMRGEPRTMQAAPRYDDVALDVFDALEARVAACAAAGIPRHRLMVDPGIGFGKTGTHNLDLLAALGLFRATGCGVLLGVSRKSFIGRLAAGEGPIPAARDRLAGSLAAGLDGVARGADILRVHDVAETVQALRVLQAIETAG